MSGHTREEALKQIEEEAEAYRARREAALSDFAANLAKERAMLDEAERAQGEQLGEEIRQGRATLDRAEREFFEQVEEARRDFDAAVEEARRSIS
jgi:small-conductance mechanosensitive channel